MNVLLLSCDTGEGHNAAGRAIQEALLERGDRVEMRSALEFASKGYSNLICSIHTQTYLKATRFFGSGYEACERSRGRKGVSFAYCLNALYGEKLYRYIVENRFDTVIATHVFPAEALTYIRRKYPTDFATYFVATDYTCSPFVDETEMDAYFIPHEDLMEEFAAKGIDPLRLVSTGIPVSSVFSRRESRDGARAGLGLDGADRQVLLMGGSMGAGPVERLTEALLNALPADTGVTVLCGRNEKLLQSLNKAFPDNLRLRAVGFTKEVSLYMDASDLLITKAGGLTSTEAAVKGIPLVHMDAVPGCEERNIEFFTRHGLCAAGTEVADIVAKAAALLGDADARRAMIEAQRCTISPTAAEDLADMAAAFEAGGVPCAMNLREA